MIAFKKKPSCHTSPEEAGILERISWCAFDFSNSAFSTVVVDLVFSLYFIRIICAHRTDATFLLTFTTFLNQILVGLLLPLVGTLSDVTGKRKEIILFFYSLCTLSTAYLGTTVEGEVWKGLITYAIAHITFSFSESLVASFLPEIAPESMLGRLSGWARSAGNLGAFVSLMAIYPLLSGGFIQSNIDRIRLSFPLVAALYAVVGLPFFLFTRQRTPGSQKDFSLALKNFYLRTAQMIPSILKQKYVLLFFLAFFLYGSGATVIMVVLAVFSQMQLGVSGAEQIWLFLTLQLGSAIGAFIFGFIEDCFGPKRTLQLNLALWFICVALTLFLEQKWLFFVVSFLIGTANGSLYSVSRALMGLISPPDKVGEYFGLWGLVGRFASGIGPLVFGLLFAVNKSFQTPLFAPLVFFGCGLCVLFFLPNQKPQKIENKEAN
ncbi:MFS transporter [Candidatus Methylacidiphilum infernorum]|uniref:MFS transporter n=1 Tax=Candidatus Methylacidiphilum infernorum TaxID=511746 RepID=A0ABX7PX45_9BACT|nr:MFS transporter [Candidatus Methylacidiphilum infernorum]QSR87477.1 MFS transporter [Candidatus Methylacidiphilum infernorum]